MQYVHNLEKDKTTVYSQLSKLMEKRCTGKWKKKGESEFYYIL